MEDRIVGGNGVTIKQHPYMISLRFRKQHLCGAAVLTIKSGLTAAHCLNEFEVPADYSAVAGSTSRAGDSGAQTRILDRFLLHPEYQPPSQEYDVGLIFWPNPLTLGPNVRPIKLPEPFSKTPSGLAITTGWGFTRESGPLSDTLRSISTPLIDSETCNQEIYHSGYIRSSMLCAGRVQGGPDVCTGDR